MDFILDSVLQSDMVILMSARACQVAHLLRGRKTPVYWHQPKKWSRVENGRSLGWAAGLCAALTIAAFAEEVDNPVYKTWAKFKPGTYIVFESFDGRLEQVITEQLKEVTSNNVVIVTFSEFKTSDLETFLMERDPPRPTPGEHSVSAQIAEADLSEFGRLGEFSKISDVKAGIDILEIGGKKLQTTTLEATIESSKTFSIFGKGGKATTHKKFWSSPDVPGGRVKSEYHTECEGRLASNTTALVGCKLRGAVVRNQVPISDDRQKGIAKAVPFPLLTSAARDALYRMNPTLCELYHARLDLAEANMKLATVMKGMPQVGTLVWDEAYTNGVGLYLLLQGSVQQLDQREVNTLHSRNPVLAELYDARAAYSPASREAGSAKREYDKFESPPSPLPGEMAVFVPNPAFVNARRRWDIADLELRSARQRVRNALVPVQYQMDLAAERADAREDFEQARAWWVASAKSAVSQSPAGAQQPDVLLAAAIAAARKRTFTLASGATLQAEVVAFSADAATMKRSSDGNVYSLPLSYLVPSDRVELAAEWAESWQLVEVTRLEGAAAAGRYKRCRVRGKDANGDVLIELLPRSVEAILNNRNAKAAEMADLARWINNRIDVLNGKDAPDLLEAKKRIAEYKAALADYLGKTKAASAVKMRNTDFVYDGLPVWECLDPRKSQ
jgi:hypothetical protein